MSDDDGDLRARFTQLRRGEEMAAPEFAWPARDGLARDRRWQPGRLIAAAVCLIVIMGAAWWMRGGLYRRRSEAGATVASIAGWKSPTDFLLETPGRDLLQSVPTIGQWSGFAEAKPKPKQTHRRIKK
jgi:hypothetical protein